MGCTAWARPQHCTSALLQLRAPGLQTTCIRAPVGCSSARTQFAMSSTIKHAAAMDDVNPKGAFVRKESAFRNAITRDGSSGFPAEMDRYHLYVSLACPWAHRVLIVRALKGLQSVLPVTVVHYYMDEMGWRFARNESEDEFGKATPEPLYGVERIRNLYFKAQEDYSGRFTVPVLWDKKQSTIVNNESKEIIRMLNSEFNEFAANPQLDLNPTEQAAEIDAVAESFYNSVNNGVYRCGFARTQEAYDVAYKELFAGLDLLEERLSKSRFLCGDAMTLADVRLFTTLVRFDSVYYVHFKCNGRRVVDYPNLAGFTRDMYQTPAIRSTVDLGHIKKHYYTSHPTINPFRIVPHGPDDLDYDAPHHRDTKFN
eukprot:Plantae.Rhodophyta-Rhodochaete_pulchella.ctg4262.p1 GENE.Plantae.Rhodophyta-Rhodochaete_pulchella.ctg4262~~Plantae.Rhodophyta-Rhodochaete_pulchella.ctg4262.p1  ORF type:complete len:370 (-),score=49.44 Plantae.Rhodophyta-Rhodochaete_pulchella.ctg4262:238-1347(-)